MMVGYRWNLNILYAARPYDLEATQQETNKIDLQK